jgi:ABC-2 type transport system permease protein
VSSLRLLARQVRYENRAFWRNPAAAFFTFAFPLIFMVIFNEIFGAQTSGNGISGAQFYTPAIVAFAIVNACYTNLAMSVAIARDEGILKRIHGSPLPTWVYLAARISHAVLIGLILVVIVTAFGYLAYSVPLPTGQLPGLVLVLLIGSACFCALGLAVSGLIPNAQAAPAIVNATVLPLLFISDVFISIDKDSFLATLANLFPIRHFSVALQAVYLPATSQPLNLVDLAWLAGWGVLGLALALRVFTWEPRK